MRSMPPSKLPGAPAMRDDNWEVRAVTIAARLDQAADELRDLINDLRRTTEEKRQQADGNES